MIILCCVSIFVNYWVGIICHSCRPASLLSLLLLMLLLLLLSYRRMNWILLFLILCVYFWLFLLICISFMRFCFNHEPLRVVALCYDLTWREGGGGVRLWQGSSIFCETFRWMPFIYFLSSLSHFCLILLWIIVLSFLFSFLFSSKLKHWSEVGIWIKSMPRCFLLLDKSARIWDVYGMLGTCCIVVLLCLLTSVWELTSYNHQ